MPRPSIAFFDYPDVFDVVWYAFSLEPELTASRYREAGDLLSGESHIMLTER